MKGSVYLGFNMLAIQNQLLGNASLIKEMSGKPVIGSTCALP